MNLRNKILIIMALLFTLQLLTTIKSKADEFYLTSDSEKCSIEIEGLKLCADSSQITVKSGEPIAINLTWSNSFGIDRRIGRRHRGYLVTIVDEKGEKLNTRLQQEMIDRQKRIENQTATEEDKKGFIRQIAGGSDRGIDIEANQTETDRIRLTDTIYDYDLTKKGKYKVTISRKVPSFEYEKTIEFVIEDIEIKVN